MTNETRNKEVETKNKGVGGPIGWLVVSAFGLYGSGANVISIGLWGTVGIVSLILLITRLVKKN